MNIGMIAGLRYPQTSNEKEYAVATSQKTKSFVAQMDKIRFELRLMEEHGRSLPEQEAFARGKLRIWLKKNTDDFIGDHYCPQILCRQTDAFRRGLTEIHLLEALGREETRQLCGSGVEIEDVVGGTQKFDTCYMTVSDTAIADNPLVYVSPAFERLSGYGRDFCIGRNDRFLWPPEDAINTLFNQSEIDSMTKFLLSDGADKGETWYGFLLNVDSKGAPFWSLQTVRKIALDGKVYIVGISTQARTRQDLLSELAHVATPEAAAQVTALRAALVNRRSLGESLPDMLDRAVACWVVGAQSLFGAVRVPVGPTTIPTVGIEIDVCHGDPYALPNALRAGVRHIHFVLREAKDRKSRTAERNVFALRLLETLARIREEKQMRLAHALFFSIRVPAAEVSLVAEVARTLETFNLRLELSSIGLSGPREERDQAWSTLCDLATAGLTRCVGAYGSLADAGEVASLETRRPHVFFATVSLFSDPKALQTAMQKLGRAIQLVALNVTASGTLLDGIEPIAYREGVPPALLLARWSQELGWPCVLADPPDFEHADFLRAMSQPMSATVFEDIARAADSSTFARFGNDTQSIGNPVMVQGRCTMQAQAFASRSSPDRYLKRRATTELATYLHMQGSKEAPSLEEIGEGLPMDGILPRLVENGMSQTHDGSFGERMVFRRASTSVSRSARLRKRATWNATPDDADGQLRRPSTSGTTDLDPAKLAREFAEQATERNHLPSYASPLRPFSVDGRMYDGRSRRVSMELTPAAFGNKTPRRRSSVSSDGQRRPSEDTRPVLEPPAQHPAPLIPAAAE